MKKDYIDNLAELESLLLGLYHNTSTVYDILWLILAYGISIQDVISLQRKDIYEGYKLIHPNKQITLEPVHELLLQIMPSFLRTAAEPECYLVYSHKYTKYKPGSSATTLTRSRCSVILNSALKEYHSELSAESLRKTYVYLYLKRHHTLVGSSFEYLQYRHDKIKDFLALSEEEYLRLTSNTEELHPELKKLELNYHSNLVQINAFLENGDYDTYNTLKNLAVDGIFQLNEALTSVQHAQNPQD